MGDSSDDLKTPHTTPTLCGTPVLCTSPNRGPVPRQAGAGSSNTSPQNPASSARRQQWRVPVHLLGMNMSEASELAAVLMESLPMFKVRKTADSRAECA